MDQMMSPFVSVYYMNPLLNPTFSDGRLANPITQPLDFLPSLPKRAGRAWKNAFPEMRK